MEKKETSESTCNSSEVQCVVMPLQPIKDGRFVPNRIVEKLLETSTIDLNDIAMMPFTDQERMQLAQLIGYSLTGFGELSYVDDETYNAAEEYQNTETELECRVLALRETLEKVRIGAKIAACALFKIHPDDLEV